MTPQIKRLLFPFFEESNHFLFSKWWFRLLVVIYVIGIFILPFYLLGSYASQTNWCYSDLITLHHFGTQDYNQAEAFCAQQTTSARNNAFVLAALTTIALHYIIQLIFFKVIIDYIVLGRSKRKIT